MKTKKELRFQLIPWKRAAKEAANNICYISGSTESLEVHHANVAFSEILTEALQNLNLEYHNDTEDYTQEELDALINEVVKMHDNVIPVVLTHDIHLALHQKYGTHVDMNQVEEFKKLYKGW